MINDNYSFYLGHTNTEGEQNNEELISIDPDQTILGLSWVSDNGGFNIKGIANISEKSIHNCCAKRSKKTRNGLYFRYKEISSNM